MESHLRSRQQMLELRLIPMAEFEEAVKRVVKVPKKAVDEKMADAQAVNKAKRQARQ